MKHLLLSLAVILIAGGPMSSFAAQSAQKCSVSSVGQFCKSAYSGTAGICKNEYGQGPVCKTIISNQYCGASLGSYCWMDDSSAEVGQCLYNPESKPIPDEIECVRLR